MSLSEFGQAGALLPGTLRRLAVFPIHTVGNGNLNTEQAWWKMREVLTEDRRMLLATKRFLNQKEVYQPREALDAADAILLGRLLDAHGLLVTTLKNRSLSMIVIGTSDGLPLWKQELQLHNSLPVHEQVSGACERLVRDFLASIPYQGFQILDPLIGDPVFEDGEALLAKVDVASKSGAKSGDPVQWVEMDRVSSEPLFQKGGQVRVIAEGIVLSRDRDLLIVDVKRVKDLKLLKEQSLVRLPLDAEKMKDAIIQDPTTGKRVFPELIATALPPRQEKNEARPLITALTSIAGLIAILLIAL